MTSSTTGNNFLDCKAIFLCLPETDTNTIHYISVHETPELASPLASKKTWRHFKENPPANVSKSTLPFQKSQTGFQEGIKLCIKAFRTQAHYMTRVVMRAGIKPSPFHFCLNTSETIKYVSTKLLHCEYRKPESYGHEVPMCVPCHHPSLDATAGTHESKLNTNFAIQALEANL